MSAREAIGLDLGGTKLAVAVVSEDLDVLHSETISSLGLGQEELVEALVGAISRAREARPGVIGAGLGIACTIDQRAGVAVAAVNLPIRDLAIRELMSERTGLPVLIDNDANLAAIAEHRFGVAQGLEEVVVVTVGTGIGGGLILDGRPYRGAIGAGAELGHTVVEAEGPRCQGSCPNRGCVEVMASGTALAREGRRAAEHDPGSTLGRRLAGGEEITGRAVVDVARAGDEAARELVQQAGRWLGVALSSWANTFNPEMIVIGGGIASGAGDLLLAPARAELRSRALPPMDRTPVEVARFGSEAGAIGGAALALAELGPEEGI